MKTPTALKCTNWKHERRRDQFRLPQGTEENESVKRYKPDTEDRTKHRGMKQHIKKEIKEERNKGRKNENQGKKKGQKQKKKHNEVKEKCSGKR